MYTGKVIHTASKDHDVGRNRYGVSDTALMGWFELRDCLASHVPPSSIRFTRRFSHLRQHQDHVTVSFTDGTSTDARVVVGGDGIFSKVRQHTLDDGLPDFTVSTIFSSGSENPEKPT